MRFAEDAFIEKHIMTIGVDFSVKTIEAYDKKIKLQIWDTSSQRFRGGVPIGNSYRGAHGLFLVCDVTNKESFDHIERWLFEINRYAIGNIPRIIIGNKIDKRKHDLDKFFGKDEILLFGYIRKYAINKYKLNFPLCLSNICVEYWPKFKKKPTKELSYDEAKAYADQYDLEYIETSCKTAENVNRAFYILTGKILKHQNQDYNSNHPYTLTNQNKIIERKLKCNDCVLL